MGRQYISSSDEERRELIKRMRSGDMTVSNKHIAEAKKGLPTRLQEWIKNHGKQSPKSNWLPVNLSSAKATKGKLETLPDNTWLFKRNASKTTYQLSLHTRKHQPTTAWEV